MSEINEQAGPSELDMLKQRAKLMGITFSNNISVDTLRAKIEAKAAGEPQPTEPEEAAQPNGLEAAAQVADQNDTSPAVPAAPTTEKSLTPIQQRAKLRADLIKDQMKLVRCRIQNLDPKKANLPGEIFTVANKILGTVRKFIPYGEVTDDGYHVPYILYKELESRKFQNIRTFKDRRTGQQRVETNWAKEFAIEVLPPLTQEELNRLATAQKAAGSVDA